MLHSIRSTKIEHSLTDASTVVSHLKIRSGGPTSRLKCVPMTPWQTRPCAYLSSSPVPLSTDSRSLIPFYTSLVLWKRLRVMVRGWNRGNSISTCSPCWSWGYSISRDIAVLFTRIINIGGRAALAIDLVLYAIMSNWYYDLLPGINVPGTIETAFSKECTLPRHWTGCGVVIGVVVIYLMCALALTIILRYATHIILAISVKETCGIWSLN